MHYEVSVFPSVYMSACFIPNMKFGVRVGSIQLKLLEELNFNRYGPYTCSLNQILSILLKQLIIQKTFM
jgi:hypothetical protein